MPGIIKASDLNNFEKKFIAPARFTLQHTTLMKSLAHNEPLPEKQGGTLNQPKYGEFEAQDAQEGVEVDNPQIPAQYNVTFVPTEIVAQFVLTDRAVRVGGENHVRNGGKLLGQAMAKKLEKKGLARFANYATHALGGAGTVITLGHVRAAITALEANAEPTEKPYWMVLRPETMNVLLNLLTPGTSGAVPEGLSQQVIEQYFRHDFALYGLKGGFSTALLDKDANDDAVGAVFSKEATWYVPADNMEIEKDRRIKARAWLYQASHSFCFGEWDESKGVKMTFDAVTPTA